MKNKKPNEIAVQKEVPAFSWAKIYSFYVALYCRSNKTPLNIGYDEASFSLSSHDQRVKHGRRKCRPRALDIMTVKHKQKIQLFPNGPSKCVPSDVLRPLRHRDNGKPHVLIRTKPYSKLTIAISTGKTPAMRIATVSFGHWIIP